MCRVAKQFSFPAAVALPDKPSIAVLSFTNMSDDAKQNYFCDGLVEGIGAAKRNTLALDAGSQCVRIGPTVFGRAGACCLG